MSHANRQLARYGDLTWDDIRPTHADQENATVTKLTRDLPLKCGYCGEAWVGTVAGIGKYCDQNPSMLIGRPGDVRQCRPEELEGDINWDVEVF